MSSTNLKLIGVFFLFFSGECLKSEIKKVFFVFWMECFIGQFPDVGIYFRKINIGIKGMMHPGDVELVCKMDGLRVNFATANDVNVFVFGTGRDGFFNIRNHDATFVLEIFLSRYDYVGSVG